MIAPFLSDIPRMTSDVAGNLPRARRENGQTSRCRAINLKTFGEQVSWNCDLGHLMALQICSSSSECGLNISKRAQPPGAVNLRLQFDK
jgi:hypothetical protein